MNERAAIERIKAQPVYRTAEGSTPRQITTLQQKAANTVGRLLKHAHARGKRKNAKWI